jgi:phosphoglycerate dehydrogenase-like enzyme
MKIAVLAPRNPWMEQSFAELQKALGEDTLVFCAAGQEQPPADTEILLAAAKIDRPVLARLPQLICVQTLSAGYENIDLSAADELGIWVSFAPSEETGNAASVAEFAVLLMLAAARYLPRLQPPQKYADRPAARPQLALQGKTACIIGLGGIGRLLLYRLRPFGMRFTGTDGHPETAPPDIHAYPPANIREAVADADFVIVCARADKENENLIDEQVIAACKHGAIIINIARGTLIDEHALQAAVERGQILTAALDVVLDEPIRADNPLLSHEQIIVTPHVAGITDITQAGTRQWVLAVIDDIRHGRKPSSILNTPSKPRRKIE